jgi:hypothetical protein
MIIQYWFDKVSSVYCFGKYHGKTIKEVWTKDIGYIEWCILNIEGFYISANVLAELKSQYPHIPLSEKALSEHNRKEKKKTLSKEVWIVKHSNRKKSHERTFGQYRGSYAQDIEGFSDEEIDDIFEGNPDNYWNID